MVVRGVFVGPSEGLAVNCMPTYLVETGCGCMLLRGNVCWSPDLKKENKQKVILIMLKQMHYSNTKNCNFIRRRTGECNVSGALSCQLTVEICTFVAAV